ncbi:MAG: hypothetical protein FWH56_08285, partial [Betaproteobacteria bacterium]|nr:hypothetical protein [Betaproteobacteria bacterium]
MVTPVSGSALNFSASGVAANSNPGRYAVNGALNLSFSDLLHAQSHYDSRAPAPLADTRPTPTRPSSPETSREPSRTHDSASSPAPRPSPPPQEPARANDSPRKTEQTRKQPAKSQEQANTETGNSTESSEKASGIITTGERTPQPQHEDAAVLPGLPATIAVLLNGIAGEIAEDVPGSDADPEAFRDASTHTGRPRTPMTDGGLSTRAATPADDYTMQGGEDMENDAEGQTKPNTSSPQAGRDSTAPSSPQGQTVAPSGTGNESTARINAASVDTAMNPASVNPVSVNPVSAASITPHENGGARTAPTGITTGAPDISLLNPPRLPTQAG